MNSPARKSSGYKPPSFDYLGLSPKIRKPKPRPDSSSSNSDSSIHSTNSSANCNNSSADLFSWLNMAAVEEPDIKDLDESLEYEFQVRHLFSEFS
jgi:hypothetical protein